MYIAYEKDTGKILYKASGDIECIKKETDNNIGYLPCKKETCIRDMRYHNGVLTDIPETEKLVLPPDINKDLTMLIQNTTNLEELKKALITVIERVQIKPINNI